MFENDDTIQGTLSNNYDSIKSSLEEMTEWLQSVDPFVFPGASAKEDHTRTATVGAGAFTGAQVGARIGGAFGPVGGLSGGLAGAVVGEVAAAAGHEKCTQNSNSKKP